VRPAGRVVVHGADLPMELRETRGGDLADVRGECGAFLQGGAATVPTVAADGHRRRYQVGRAVRGGDAKDQARVAVSKKYVFEFIIVLTIQSKTTQNAFFAIYI